MTQEELVPLFLVAIVVVVCVSFGYVFGYEKGKAKEQEYAAREEIERRLEALEKEQE